jgi:type II secretory pathway pseudopilin PulG
MKNVVVLLAIVTSAIVLGCQSSRNSISEEDTGFALQLGLSQMLLVSDWYRTENGRWPTSTTEVQEFMVTNYTNIIESLRDDYSNAVFTVGADGSLTIKSKHKNGSTSEETFYGGF